VSVPTWYVFYTPTTHYISPIYQFPSGTFHPTEDTKKVLDFLVAAMHPSLTTTPTLEEVRAIYSRVEIEELRFKSLCDWKFKRMNILATELSENPLIKDLDREIKELSLLKVSCDKFFTRQFLTHVLLMNRFVGEVRSGLI
jgi:hypothetical protein